MKDQNKSPQQIQGTPRRFNGEPAVKFFNSWLT